MSDVAAFVNLPYSPRVDCYGLVRKALRELGGIELPGYRYPRDGDGRAAFVRTVMADWQRVTRPRSLDVVLLNVAGKPTHVGLVVGRGRMLHTDSDRGRSRIERWDDGFHQVEGFYRFGETA